MPETPITFNVEDVKNPTLLERLLVSFARKLAELGNKVDNLARSIKIPNIGQIRDSLQSTGNTPINVTGLRGILADPQPASALRYDAAPTGLVLQSLRDSQFIIVKTSATSYDLYHVIGGNPNTLFKLIAGASGGNMMTTDTVQTVTASKTFAANQTVDINQNNATLFNVENLNTGNNTTAQVRVRGDNGRGSFLAIGSGVTATRCGVTLGSMVEILIEAGMNGLLIDTNGSDPIIFGTNNTEAGRFDSSQNFELQKKITKYRNITLSTDGGGVPSIVATAFATAQTANIGATTVYAVPASPALAYKISGHIFTSTAGSAGTVTLSVTANNGTGVNTYTTATVDLTSATAYQNFSLLFRSAGSNNIQFSTTTAGLAGGAAYSVYVTVEAM